MLLRLIPLAVLALTGCRQEALAPLGDDLEAPAAVDFGQSFVGLSRSRTVHLQSHSRAPLSLRLVADTPFDSASSLELPAGGAAELMVTLRPTHQGPLDEALHLSTGERELTVKLTAEGVAAPVCTAAECHLAHLDPELGCVDAPAPDDTGCGAGNACLSGAVCRGGQCVGSAVSCDDGDRCTADACSASGGCVHQTLTCPAPADPCRVAACDRLTGCGSVEAPDGTLCGANDCVSAQVCVAGACVTRPSPTGSLCAPATTCRGPGVCAPGGCQLPAPSPQPPLWQFLPPAGESILANTFDLEGNVYLFVASQYAWDDDGGQRSSLELLSFDRDGLLRWSQELTLEHAELQNGELLMVDSDRQVLYAGVRTWLPYYPKPDQVHLTLAEARDARTGALLWEHDLAKGIVAQNTDPAGHPYLDILRAVLAGDGGVAFETLEGYELHQSYTTGLSAASGAEAWRLQKSGHIYSLASTGDGQLWQTSAPCWSNDINAVRLKGGTAQATLDPANASFIEFDALGVLALTWDSSGATSLQSVSPALAMTPEPLPAGQILDYYGNNARSSEGRLTLVTRDPSNGLLLNRLDRSTFAPEWSLPLNASSVQEVELLRDGGVAAFLGQADGGTDLLTVSASGVALEQCPYGPVRFLGTVKGRRYGIVNYSSFAAYDAPGEDLAPTGWVLSSGHAGNTWRPR